MNIAWGSGFVVLCLLLAPACAPAEQGPPCGPNAPCPGDDDRCVWLPAEERGYCAPACGEGGACPPGLVCRPVAPTCYPCRVYSEACISPEP